MIWQLKCVGGKAPLSFDVPSESVLSRYSPPSKNKTGSKHTITHAAPLRGKSMIESQGHLTG